MAFFSATRSCGRFGPATRRLDAAEIEFELVAEQRFGRGIGAEQGLFLAVSFDERDLFVAARGEAQIGKRFVVDREKAHGGAIFGSHVGDGGAIGDAETGKSGAIELDEFSDDAFLAQYFGDGEDQVGCGANLPASGREA